MAKHIWTLDRLALNFELCHLREIATLYNSEIGTNCSGPNNEQF